LLTSKNIKTQTRRVMGQSLKVFNILTVQYFFQGKNP
jgi:hypothetical protein